MSLRVFGVDYQFLACGDVFTQGLARAAQTLGLTYAHAECRTPSLDELVRRFVPDLLFVVHGRYATKRLASILPAYQSAVWLLDEPYEVDDTSKWSGAYSRVFVCDPATLHRHERSSYLPVCYDPQAHSPGVGPRPYKVGFVGGGNRPRDRYLAALARAGLLGYVIGGTWASPEVNRLCISRNVAPSETASRYRLTRIVLNVFREQHHYNRDGIAATSLNPRVYEAFACGALVVSEWRPEAERLLPEMPTFHNEAECVALVSNLLENPDHAEALRMACAARLESHTYATRLRTVLDICGLSASEAVA